MAKHCSDLIWYVLIISTHFFSIIHAVLSGGEPDLLDHLPPQIYSESWFSVNVCPVFYLKAYICCNEPFRKGGWISGISIYW